jgi:hypothetical protein
MNSTIEIKYQNHFKLNIALKDKIVFEAEMYARNIPFHLDDNPMAYTRYFLLDEDRQQIDAVLKETGIIAGTETIRMTDYGDSKKVHRIYLCVAIVMIVLFAIASMIL